MKTNKNRAEEYLKSKGIDVNDIVCYSTPNGTDEPINMCVVALLTNFAESQTVSDEEIGVKIDLIVGCNTEVTNDTHDELCSKILELFKLSSTNKVEEPCCDCVSQMNCEEHDNCMSNQTSLLFKRFENTSMENLMKISEILERINQLVFDGVHEELIEFMESPLVEILKHHGVNLSEDDI